MTSKISFYGTSYAVSANMIDSGIWCFSTAWFGTLRFGKINFWEFFHWVQYLVLFLVPLRSRFQVNRTVTKKWSVNSADHRLAGKNCPYLLHLTVDKQKRTARFKSAQPGKDRTQVFWSSAPFLTTPKWLYHCLLRKYRHSSHWYQRSRSKRELDGVTRNENFFHESWQ